MKRVIFVLLVIFLYMACCAPVNAQHLRLTVSGSWNQTITSADLASGAGSNLNPTYLSAANATYITIENTKTPTHAWSVNVQRTAGALTLQVKRTGDGTGDPGGLITGGDGMFQTITETAQPFFNGSISRRATRSNIPCQYQLTGVSLDDAVQTNNITVTYTLTLP